MRTIQDTSLIQEMFDAAEKYTMSLKQKAMEVVTLDEKIYWMRKYNEADRLRSRARLSRFEIEDMLLGVKC